MYEKIKKVILLCTTWRQNYWESEEKAPYPKRKYTQLPDWEKLSKSCPLPGLGIYIKQKEKDFRERPFVYLKIIGMGYDEKTEAPCFDFKVIKKSRTESKILIDKLPSENKKELFSAINADQLIEILKEIGEKPPKEWLSLIGEVEISVDWRDYLGKYFLELESGNLSNNEFEDRIAKLLTALGFDVTQKGYKIKGPYCDGIAAFKGEYGIVYDCKNTIDFIPTEDDKRALERYLSDEKKVRKEKNLYGAFIAKSFGEEQKDIFYFSVESLLYLLYKKLMMGFKFNLSPFKKIFHNKINVTPQIIDKEWLER